MRRASLFLQIPAQDEPHRPGSVHCRARRSRRRAHPLFAMPLSFLEDEAKACNEREPKHDKVSRKTKPLHTVDHMCTYYIQCIVTIFNLAGRVAQSCAGAAIIVGVKGTRTTKGHGTIFFFFLSPTQRHKPVVVVSFRRAQGPLFPRDVLPLSLFR